MCFLRPLSLLAVVVLVTSLGLAPGLRAQEATPAPADTFFFQDGDKPTVILGDSITEQRMYSTLLETYVLSRFPDWKITFRNAGWNGDTAWLAQRGDFDAGLQRDVLALNPKAVTIDFGMNDARGGEATYSKYLDYQTKLVKALEKAGARVALITPSPEERYEADAPAGSHYNLMLQKYIDGLKLVSDNEKVPLVDQYTPFVAAVEAGRKAGVLSATDPAGPSAMRLTNEGIHPNWGGHLLMATAILQGLHAPAEVSSVTVDAAGKSITASDGCTVAWNDAPNGAVQISRTDRALPWPIPDDPAIDTVLKIPGFDPATALDLYEFKVTGLTAASYTLTIDNVEIGTYSSSDLGNGINLALVRKGPIFDQEQQLLKAVMAKNDAYYNRWRGVQLYAFPSWMNGPTVEEARTAELTRMDNEIAADEATIDTLRKPTAHVWRLDPVK
jgi:lysophospholipase L1-like esterase